MKHLYMSNETGEVFTYKQMMQDFAEHYDGNDPTNALEWNEYYIIID